MTTTTLTNTHILDYPVRLEPDDNGTIMVTFPDFPEAVTFGDDEADALAKGQEALTTIIEAYVKDRQRLPRPSAGSPRVTVPALAAVKAQLSELMIHSRIKKSELADRLQWHMPQVDRILDVRHGSGLDQLEAAASAMGQRLMVYLEPKPSSVGEIARQRVRGVFIAREGRSGVTGRPTGVTSVHNRSGQVISRNAAGRDAVGQSQAPSKRSANRPLLGARKR